MSLKVTQIGQSKKNKAGNRKFFSSDADFISILKIKMLTILFCGNLIQNRHYFFNVGSGHLQ